MIAVIRIKGLVDVPRDMKRTLNILKLRKKHICILLHPKKEIVGMLKKIKNYIAFGEINKETVKQLLKLKIKKGKVQFREYFFLQ